MTALFVANLIDLGESLGILALGLLALHAVERAAARFISHRLGWNAVLVTGLIGVPIHELSHLILAHVFGHRIVAWKLFEPDPATGTLGYVWHAHERPSVWQRSGNFFIGIAPLLGGGVALLAIVHWMAPGFRIAQAAQLSSVIPPPHLAQVHTFGAATAWLARVAAAMLALVKGIWRSRTLWLPLQLYLAVAVASHLAPSPRDLASATLALPIIIGVAVAMAAALTLVGFSAAYASVLAPVFGLVVGVVALFQGLYAAVVALAARAS